MQNRPVFRKLAAGLFLLVAMALVVSVLVREPRAIKSPTKRSRDTLELALAQLGRPGKLSAEARDLAYRDPLQAASFVLLGLERIQADNTAYDRVRPLMAAAAERQPSFEVPHIWLAADYARRGDFTRSLDLFDRVLSGNSAYVGPLMPVLTALMRDDASRASVFERLRRFPPWRTAVMIKAIGGNVLPREMVEALLAGPVSSKHQPMLDLERQRYLQSLIDWGEVRAAHALYRRYVGTTDRAPLYDGDFKVAKPFIPFGWTLASQAEDYAERVSNLNAGWMVRLHASGKRPVTLLEQTLALRPGRWMVRVVARDGGLAKPEQMRLSVECGVDGPPLASQSLGTLQATDRTVRLPVAVPAECPLQRLKIAADGNEGEASEIEVLSVQVDAS